jgi:hypothetical protein
MSNRVYLMVSGTVFLLVALVHLARVIEGWPVHVADWSVPVTVSWFGFVATSSLAVWAFSLFRGLKL